MDIDQNDNKCFICGDLISDSFPKIDENIIYYSYSCQVCGNVEIDQRAVAAIRMDFNEQRHIISGYCRERTYLGQRVHRISIDNIKEIISSAPYPKTIAEKIDKLLKYVVQRSHFFGDKVLIEFSKDYSITYSLNFLEFGQILASIKELNYLNKLNKEYYATRDGWMRYEDIIRNPIKTNQAFVAMQFGSTKDIQDKMLKVYHVGIERAINDAETIPKYKPIRIDRVEHNDPIDSRILVEIRKSRFVVADFTGHRGGVYFETGYALALGIPVIWTCRKDESDKMHFDTRQFNRIDWDNENDLYEKLKRRIEGSIF
jgi:hypothetical protein